MAEDLSKTSGKPEQYALDHVRPLAPATQAVHADDALNSTTDVAPPLHVATTFRYPEDPDLLRPISEHGSSDDPPPHIYSRLTAPSSTRLETILCTLLHGPSLTYSSGLSAFHALLVHLRPNVVAIGAGYHGCHGVLRLYQKLTGCVIVNLHDLSTWSGRVDGTDGDDSLRSRVGSITNDDSPDPRNTGTSWSLSKGDLVHLETPLNPDGTAFDISHFARLAHERGALLSVDATFAPPPLLDPFAWGADYVMHSGTKYLGGHSDMLCGVLAVNPAPERNYSATRPGIEMSGVDGPPGERTSRDAAAAFAELRTERVFLGSVMGSLEGWLGVRSVRTLELRVLRQSRTAGELVRRIYAAVTPATAPLMSGGGHKDKDDADSALVRRCVAQIKHASIQALESDPAPDLTSCPPAIDKQDSPVPHPGPTTTDSNPPNWLHAQMPHGFGPVFGLYMTSAELARRLPSKLALFHHATSLGGVESLIEWRRMSDDKVDPRLLRISVGVEDIEDLWNDLVGAMRALIDEGRV